MMKSIQFELNKLLLNNPKVNKIANMGVNFEMGKLSGEDRPFWHFTDVITLGSPQQIIDFSINVLTRLEKHIEDLNNNSSDLYFIKINFMVIQMSKQKKLKLDLILNYLIFYHQKRQLSM